MDYSNNHLLHAPSTDLLDIWDYPHSQYNTFYYKLNSICADTVLKSSVMFFF